MSTGQANVRTKSYRDMYDKLPARVKEDATEAFAVFLVDPHHPTLENHELYDSKKGRHKKASRAVSVNRRYRALYVVDGPTNVWYWIGSHEDYNNFTGSKK